MLIWGQRVAAGLFVPLLAACWLLYTAEEPKEEKPVEMLEVKTCPGMIATVDLPDGTKVALNSSSSLRYPSSFVGDTREVSLTGEAFFDVAHDEKRQFIVLTPGNARIAVHGTEFDVEAYDENSVETTLISGKVCFSYLDKNTRYSLMMEPGQQVVFDVPRKNVTVHEANVEVETAWRSGRLVFRNTPFEEALKSLSKRYNVEFIIKNPALKRHSFTATFTKQRLERILEIFRISSNIHFNYVENENVDTEKQIIEVY